MVKTLPLVILVLACVISFKHYVETRVMPNTAVSMVNISGNSRQNVAETLIDAVSKPVSIRIKNRVYDYRYSDLGITLDLDTTIRTVFEENSAQFPKPELAFLNSLRSNTLILPALSFNHDFYNFSRDSIFDFSTNPDKIQVDNTAKRLVFQQNEEKYTIDPQSLKTQIIMNFGRKTIIEPKLVKMENKAVAKVLGMNTVLMNVFDNPVYIEVHENGSSPRFTIPPDQLKQLIEIKYDEESHRLAIEFVEDKLNTLTGNIGGYLRLDADKKINAAELKKDLISLINSRSQGQNTDTVVAKAGFTANTNGNLAQKYIEVDISQQTMYLFKDGNLANTFRISTGLYYPTPVGRFTILNKAVNAFSDIYNVWMPYWMAFYYGPEVDAYFGIHELPYWIAEDGAKIQRPREFIGTPRTGGCVALDVGAAKEVYAFSDVGTPLYIYN